MPNENEHLQEGVEEEVASEVESTQEELDSQDEEDSNDVVTISKTEFTKLKRQALAYKAQKETKSQTPTPKPSEAKNSSVTETVIEEKILLAQGIEAELLQEMKALAAVRGKSLLEIQKDPIIVAMKEIKEKQELEKKARLGVSRGAKSNNTQKRDFSTPGLSKEEHKRLWKEQFSNK